MPKMADPLVSQVRYFDIQRLIGFTRSYAIQDISQTSVTERLLASSSSVNNELWPEEQHALEDIMTGKTKMIRQTGEEFLKELNDVLNE
jgi:hypothetical protein